MDKKTLNKWVLLLLVIFISALFLSMIRQFLMAIFLAGIFSAIFHPVHLRMTRWFKGRRGLASAATVLLIILVILIPLAGLIGVITAQAVKVGSLVKPWMETQMSKPGAMTRLVESLPFVRSFELIEKFEPYRREILGRLGEAVSGISGFLVNKLSSITFGTFNFILMTFIMLYTMFYFFLDGHTLMKKILYYLPLQDQDEQRMLDRFTSVTRATVKGTLVIGILQGGLAGLAFAVAGIPSAVFWGTLMTVLSVIPGIGSALIWVPTALILAIAGEMAAAIMLAVFCALVVGSLDNLLRPILVGKDTQMHELLIFFGTLGGLLMFGIPGFIIGPIIAALFATVWDIYGVVFREYLPPVEMRPLNDPTEESAEAIPKSEPDVDPPEEAG